MSLLKFYYGTMGAGKSTEAIKTYTMYTRAGRKTLIAQANPGGDGVDFNGEGYVDSRLCNKKLPAYIFTDVDNIPLKDNTNLIVDEVQFLPPKEIDKLASLVDDKGINVICYGLKTDCYGNLFEGASRLLAIADETKELPSLCDICHDRPATRHIRYIGEALDRGGNDPVAERTQPNIEYYSVCRKCWKDVMNKQGRD